MNSKGKIPQDKNEFCLLFKDSMIGDKVKRCENGIGIFCGDFEQLLQERLNTLSENESVKEYNKTGGMKWTVMLRQSPTSDFYDRYIKNNFKIKKIEHDDYIHRGHFLAHSFKDFLVPRNLYQDFSKTKQKIDHYFGKGNEDNIYYQTKKANCNSTDFHGQLYFEDKVLNFFKNELVKDNCDYSVLYEIEDIRCDKQPSCSLGRRLLIIFLKDKKIIQDKVLEARFNNYHVFIPNYLNDELE